MEKGCSFGSSVPGVPAVASGRRVVMPGLPSADVRLVTVTARSWCSHTTPVDCVVATNKKIDFKPPDFSFSVNGGHVVSPVLNSRSSVSAHTCPV